MRLVYLRGLLRRERRNGEPEDPNDSGAFTWDNSTQMPVFDSKISDGEHLVIIELGGIVTPGTTVREYKTKATPARQTATGDRL